MKRILLIATGGTISSQDSGLGLSPEIGAETLLKYIPEMTEKYKIDTLQIFNIESSDLEPIHWEKLVQAIKNNYDNYDGFIIVHGTDSLAYTSSALSYMIQNISKTIVVTGAQYPIEFKTTDAIRNLQDSCLFAAESEMPGVYAVFAGKVMLGNHIKKVRSKSFDAFESVNYPDAAAIRKDTIVKYYKTPVITRKPEFKEKTNDKIFHLKFYPSIRPEYYQFVGSHFKAVVMEGYGLAGIPVSFMPLFQQWYEKDIVMVVNTQAVYEGSDLGVYTVGKAMLKKFQVLQGYDMTLEAVMAKLMVIMGTVSDISKIKEQFLLPVQADIMYSDTVSE